MMKKGKLYLIPTPLGENAVHTIPNYVIKRLHKIDVFIAERAKTARAFIKTTKPVKPFSELEFFELNKRTQDSEIPSFLKACAEGKDIGLLSEAGCPGVADPGAVVVKLAHEQGIEVVPLVGPSSILLALMASGMNGQSFAFLGYLPVKKGELDKALKRLEQNAQRFKQTQIFIETPYRNGNLVETALKYLSPQTQFCVAADISLETEYIKSQSISKWRKDTIPDLHKRPAIFLIGK